MSPDPTFLYGLHDAGGEHLFLDAQVQGWVVFNEFIGQDPVDASGVDYSSWADRGFGVIVKLQHGFNPAGTIPEPAQYPRFAERCARFAAVSTGCHNWVIGNEMNYWAARPKAHARNYVPILRDIKNPAAVHAILRALPERFDALYAGHQTAVGPTRGIPITPDLYASCYRHCRNAILAAQPSATVLAGAVTPWNTQTRYAGNEKGDWATYLNDILIRLGPHGCDGIALQAHTVDANPESLTQDAWLEGDYQSRRASFRAYQDFMQSIPLNMRHLPVFIVEADQYQPWTDRDSGWVQGAYAEIARWNQQPGAQQIHCLSLFRWAQSPGDRWGLAESHEVQRDLRKALAQQYQWDPARMPLPDPGDPQDRTSLTAGMVVETVSAINLRVIPGFIGVTEESNVALLPARHQCYIADGPMRIDSLIWWLVHTTDQMQQQVSGWVPQAGIDGEPYLKRIAGAPDFTEPFEPAPIHYDESLAPGTYFLLLQDSELRHSPGTWGKDASDVIRLIPGNTPGLILEGPQYVGESIWWRARLALPEGGSTQGWLQEKVGETDKHIQVIAVPGTPPSPKPRFGIGAKVYVQRSALLRRVPGLAMRTADGLVVQLAPGQELTIEKGPRRVDDLQWWDVSTSPSLIPIQQGWVPEVSSSGYDVLADTQPQPAASPDQPFQQGDSLYVIENCALQRSPGRKGKTPHDLLDTIPRNTLCVVLAGPQALEDALWWQIAVTASSRENQWGWIAQTDTAGRNQVSGEPLPVEVAPVPRRAPTERERAHFAIGDRVMNVSPQTVRIRATPGNVNKGDEDIIIRAPRRGLMSIQDGPREVDGLHWWLVQLEYPETTRPAGWVTEGSRGGMRILAYDFLADHIKVANPFEGQYALSQAWGSNPDFYGRFSYGGVPLRGHNGFDFALPMGTPLLTCDKGKVLRVSFGTGGLGKFVLMEHDWGESLYGHMDEIEVAVGQMLPSRSRIGVSGNTGNSTGPHLHLGIKIIPYRRTDGWGGYCNPAPFMDVNNIFRQRPVPMPPSGIGEDAAADPLP